MYLHSVVGVVMREMASKVASLEYLVKIEKEKF